MSAAEAMVTQRWAAGQPSSRYVGVRWGIPERRWKASITYKLQDHPLGLYLEEEDAARAFDAAARIRRGSAAHGGRASTSAPVWRLNFPTEAEAAAAPDDVEWALS